MRLKIDWLAFGIVFIALAMLVAFWDLWVISGKNEEVASAPGNPRSMQIVPTRMEAKTPLALNPP